MINPDFQRLKWALSAVSVAATTMFVFALEGQR
jgi:hypothetical protein